MTYLENSSLEFSSCIQNNSFNNLILFRIFYKLLLLYVFAVSDKTDLSITPFKIGNKRITLN
jgi:hypothetical protein